MNDKQKAQEMKEDHIHWRSGLKSVPYIGGHDLKDYKPIQLTIKEVKKEMSHGLKENSIFNIIYFTDKAYKPMLLNATNSKMVRALSGSPFIDQWSGLTIELSVKQGIRAFGETFDALRITSKRIKTVKPEITKDHPKFAEIKAKYDAGSSIDVIRKYYNIDEKILKS